MNTKAQPILPNGTKVVHRKDARVGLVVQGASGEKAQYCVRFADGQEETFDRDELSIFKHADSIIPLGALASELEKFVIFRCVVGSTAFGLNVEGSDTDRRGFYLPPAELHWGLGHLPEQLENGEQCYWEIEKFLRLALKANPNILECLYSPLVGTCTPLAAELLGMRETFLSRHVYQTYNSYVLSQFKKLERDLRNGHGVRWKHVMHLIRLLLSGTAILETGQVSVRVDAHRDQLLAIRRGEVEWERVEKWRLDLHRRMDEALADSVLPQHPDYRAVNEFLLKARRFAASAEYAGA